MTAPTSPGVVPADVRKLAKKACDDFGASKTYKPLATFVEQAIMADRANRPSLTEDEREQVRREALEEAAQRADAYWNSNTVPPYYGACPVAARIRALADRSEPRQDMEGDRG